MNLWHRVFSKLQQMVAEPYHGHADPTTALEWLDKLAGKVVTIHQSRVALVVDREMMRAALTGLAFEYGLRTPRPRTLLERIRHAFRVLLGRDKLEVVLDDLVLFEWPPDPEPKPEPTKVIAPEPKRLVVLQ